MIDSVKIEGYKSISSQEVKLRSMNILLGGNGVGKSNFLSVFDFFRKIVQSRDYEYAHASKHLQEWSHNVPSCLHHRQHQY